MKDEKKELIEFVDQNVLGKSNTVEEFTKNIGTVCSYLQLKGPVSDEVVAYFNNLTECSKELMSIRSKGIELSTSGFYPNKFVKKDDKDFGDIGSTSLDDHYDYGCGSSRSYHYSSGCS
jgi:hypothetical protein